MRKSAWLLPVVMPFFLSGCFAQLLATPATTLDYTCALIGPDGPDRVEVRVWGDAPFALGGLVAILAEVSGRPASSFHVGDSGKAPSADRVEAWAAEHPDVRNGDLQLHIVWLGDGAGNETGRIVAPGLVALDVPAIERGAQRMGRAPVDVARAVLLHHLGHALGVVNRGIPVVDADIKSREGPPGHDPDPASVLHVGWEDARTMAWSPNATYVGYSQDILADWSAARAPGGVCAA